MMMIDAAVWELTADTVIMVRCKVVVIELDHAWDIMNRKGTTKRMLAVGRQAGISDAKTPKQFIARQARKLDFTF